MKLLLPVPRYVACAVLALLVGCAHDGQKSDKPLSPRGVDAATILGRLLSPMTWDETRRARLTKTILPLEYHGASGAEKTLIHAKLAIDGGELHDLIAEHKRSTPDFATDIDANHVFGPNSNKTLSSDGSGASHLLSWWKPGDLKKCHHYCWTLHPEGKRVTRIWLQDVGHEKGKRVLYAHIESK